MARIQKLHSRIYTRIAHKSNFFVVLIRNNSLKLYVAFGRDSGWKDYKVLITGRLAHLKISRKDRLTDPFFIYHSFGCILNKRLSFKPDFLSKIGTYYKHCPDLVIETVFDGLILKNQFLRFFSFQRIKLTHNLASLHCCRQQF